MSDLRIEKVFHYGVLKVATETEKIRHEVSLCYNCSRLKLNDKDNCAAAAELFRVVTEFGLGVIVTLCPSNMFERSGKDHEKVDPGTLL